MGLVPRAVAIRRPGEIAESHRARHVRVTAEALHDAFDPPADRRGSAPGRRCSGSGVEEDLFLSVTGAEGRARVIHDFLIRLRQANS